MLPAMQNDVAHGDIWNAMTFNPFPGKAKTEFESQFICSL
jgi:hypothetical protein